MWISIDRCYNVDITTNSSSVMARKKSTLTTRHKARVKKIDKIVSAGRKDLLKNKKKK